MATALGTGLFSQLACPRPRELENMDALRVNFGSLSLDKWRSLDGVTPFYRVKDIMPCTQGLLSRGGVVVIVCVKLQHASPATRNKVEVPAVNRAPTGSVASGLVPGPERWHVECWETVLLVELESAMHDRHDDQEQPVHGRSRGPL